jgi:ribosomal protein S26
MGSRHRLSEISEGANRGKWGSNRKQGSGSFRIKCAQCGKTIDAAKAVGGRYCSSKCQTKAQGGG